MKNERSTARGLSVAVRVGGEDWTEVSGLAEAGPDAAVFAVDTTGHVVFGDGTHGRQPAAGALVTVSFRQGGGHTGNVGLSVTTPWPPPEGLRYQVALGSNHIGVRAGDPTAAIESIDGARRVRYFAGQMLGARDFQDEQEYLREKRLLHNRALHGAGVAAGLAVSVTSSSSSPALVIEPGLALDSQGRELELRAPARLDIGTINGPALLVIEYTERQTNAITLPDQNAPVATRITEGVCVRIADEDVVGAGIALARIVPDTSGWIVDTGFVPERCR